MLKSTLKFQPRSQMSKEGGFVMNLKKLSIGQMAKLNKISEQTLRLYDKMNLLKPQYINEHTGYRYYSIGQSATLDMIQYYKEIGIPLEEIRKRLNAMNINSMSKLLKDRYDYIEKQMKKLKNDQSAIIRSIDNFNRYISLPQIGKIFYEYISQRQICVYKTGADFFSYSYYEYEYYLRLFKDYLLEHDFPITYFTNVGTIMRHKHLLAETPDFFSDEFFVFIDDIDNCPLEVETIPAGTYLSMCCREFDKEKEYAKQLFEKMKEKNYKPLGDYFCEVVAEYPNNENGQREIFYKMQIQIK